MPPTKDTALALFHQGRWADAEPALTACVAAAPRDADLLRALAQLRFMAQRLPEALALMDRIIAGDPRDAAALNSKGAILTASGRFAEAAETYDAAIAIDPSLVKAHANRAVALAALGRTADALASAEAALALDPANAGALASRGMALMALGKPAEAVPALERALQADPGNIAARLDLASALIATKGHARVPDLLAPLLAAQPGLRQARMLEIVGLQGARRYTDALDRAEALLREDPEDEEALLAAGDALGGLGRFADSLDRYRRAHARSPADPDIVASYAKALFGMGQREEALALLEDALARHPRHPDLVLTQISALLTMERDQDALAAFRRATADGPLPPEAQLSLIYAMLDVQTPQEAAAVLEQEIARDPTALRPRIGLLRVRRQLFDWRDEARLLGGIARDVAAEGLSFEPLALMALVDDPAAHLAASRAWAKELYPALPAIWRGERYRHDRIRLGYISTDLRDHAVSQLMAGVFEKHDHARFETTAFAIDQHTADSDPLRPRLARAFDRFLTCQGMSDEAIAQRIRELEVDVLIDLNGQTRGVRTSVFAQRPAPVQAVYLGYPGTTGLDYMDYIIADPVVIPPDAHGYYTEQVATLPDCYLPADDRRQVAFVPGRAAAGLPATGFVFCAFNARYKIHPGLFDIWMRILRAVPGSILWLSHASGEVAENLRREAAARGVDGARLVFAPRVPMDVHLGRQRFADLFLDTLPYNAHTTASDALWAGLPVLTTPGRAFAGRVAASLLTSLGMPELIAPTPEAYEAMAIELAQDAGRMAAIRAKLDVQRRIAPAFDTERFCRHLEDAVAIMHDRAQRGLPPQAFAVPPRPPRHA